MRIKKHHPLYITWMSMVSRCVRPKDHTYKWYGAKGICVSDRWRNNFWDFVDDMGERPSPKHTLDRIDNSGNYCKDNCRWATPKEQSSNRSQCIKVEYNGRVYGTIMELANEINMPFGRLYYRLKICGHSVEKAVNTPLTQHDNRNRNSNGQYIKG